MEEEKLKKKNMILQIYDLKYEELDCIIKEKIKEEKERLDKLDEEEKNSVKNSIIMKAMYEQGFKDGVNLIIDCRK